MRPLRGTVRSIALPPAATSLTIVCHHWNICEAKIVAKKREGKGIQISDSRTSKERNCRDGMRFESSCSIIIVASLQIRSQIVVHKLFRNVPRIAKFMVAK